jgi:hypothetical protein
LAVSHGGRRIFLEKKFFIGEDLLGNGNQPLHEEDFELMREF